MKKILLILIITMLSLVLCACSSNKASTDPLASKWVRIFDEGASKVLFSIEEIGDLDITIWKTSAVSGELEQTDDYAGSYKADKENCTITLSLDGEEYFFDYVLVENETLTLTYEGAEYEFDHVGGNKAAD